MKESYPEFKQLQIVRLISLIDQSKTSTQLNSLFINERWDLSQQEWEIVIDLKQKMLRKLNQTDREKLIEVRASF
jgi:hypothetical protein